MASQTLPLWTTFDWLPRSYTRHEVQKGTRRTMFGFLYSLFSVLVGHQWVGVQISCTKTQTLPNVFLFAPLDTRARRRRLNLQQIRIDSIDGIGFKIHSFHVPLLGIRQTFQNILPLVWEGLQLHQQVLMSLYRTSSMSLPIQAYITILGVWLPLTARNMFSGWFMTNRCKSARMDSWVLDWGDTNMECYLKQANSVFTA